MKRYELTFLTTSNFSKEETEEISEKIAKFITEGGGNIEEVKMPVKKNLISLVSKRREIFVTSIFFFLSPDKIKDLKDFILLEKTVIRHIIICKKKDEEENSVARRVPKSELKEIDEKIDEILKN